MTKHRKKLSLSNIHPFCLQLQERGREKDEEASVLISEFLGHRSKKGTAVWFDPVSTGLALDAHNVIQSFHAAAKDFFVPKIIFLAAERRKKCKKVVKVLYTYIRPDTFSSAMPWEILKGVHPQRQEY